MKIKETIVTLVSELSSLDVNQRVFGVKRHSSGIGHDYRFNEPIDARRVSDFESYHRIQLPEDYREFILTVGDGGAGPHYGVKSLVEASRDSRLSEPFPWNSEVSLSSEAEYDLWETYPGVLVAADRGCAYFDIMVVNGEAHGQIWNDFTSVDGPLKSTHHSFLDWYVDWALRCINTIKREPLLDRITVGMTIEDLQRILGPEIYRWDSTACLQDSPVYFVGCKKTNATFEIDENNRVKQIHRTNQI